MLCSPGSCPHIHAPTPSQPGVPGWQCSHSATAELSRGRWEGQQPTHHSQPQEPPNPMREDRAATKDLTQDTRCLRTVVKKIPKQHARESLSTLPGNGEQSATPAENLCSQDVESAGKTMTHHSRATLCPQVCHGTDPPQHCPPAGRSPSGPLGCSGDAVITSSPAWGAEPAPQGWAGHVPCLGRVLSPRHRVEGRDESSRYPKDVSEPSVVCLAGEW